MRIFDFPPEGEASDDDPPSRPPRLTCDERTELIATIMRLLWRIVSITTERGTKPLQTIGLYCKDIKYVYYGIHPNDHSRDSIRIESARHKVDGPLHPRTLQPLTDEQLRELKEIATYELKQLTEQPQKEQ